MGWFRRELGSGLLARSICRITDPEGARDQIWIAAEHEDSGDYWILRMDKPWEQGDDSLTANFMDAALSYSGAATDSGAGADHLEGMTVQVLADGAPHPDIVIGGGGTWALEREASDITLGLEFAAEIELLPMGSVQGDVTAQARIKRVGEVQLSFLESAGVEIEVQGLAPYPLELQGLDAEMDEAVPLFTGDHAVPTLGGFDKDGTITIRRTQPLPVTLTAVRARVEVHE
jgi:hypothetical protein